MSQNVHRKRRSFAILIVGVTISLLLAYQNYASQNQTANDSTQNYSSGQIGAPLARDSLEKLAIKGRAPKVGYSRDKFGSGWSSWKSCDTRQRILARDMISVRLDVDGCTVLSGTLHDPYTGRTIQFRRGSGTSTAVQIDHVVALSDAWQKGAQTWTASERETLANDDLELLAVDGSANQQKSDGDAATWLPSNKAFRCQYVARQIAVKVKYSLWITTAEHDAMARVLDGCPEQHLPTP